MIGMLQIMTYLLCVYLVFKGFEVLQIALASNREDRAGIIVIGVIAVAIAIAASFYFVKMIDGQAAAVSNRPSSSSE
jgi:hypothetical protein